MVRVRLRGWGPEGLRGWGPEGPRGRGDGGWYPKATSRRGPWYNIPWWWCDYNRKIAFDVLCFSRKAGDVPREARAQHAAANEGTNMCMYICMYMHVYACTYITIYNCIIHIYNIYNCIASYLCTVLYCTFCPHSVMTHGMMLIQHGIAPCHDAQGYCVCVYVSM